MILRPSFWKKHATQKIRLSTTILVVNQVDAQKQQNKMSEAFKFCFGLFFGALPEPIHGIHCFCVIHNLFISTAKGSYYRPKVLDGKANSATALSNLACFFAFQPIFHSFFPSCISHFAKWGSLANPHFPLWYFVRKPATGSCWCPSRMVCEPWKWVFK
jgi:hypothetical protein